MQFTDGLDISRKKNLEYIQYISMELNQYFGSFQLSKKSVKSAYLSKKSNRKTVRENNEYCYIAIVLR